MNRRPTFKNTESVHANENQHDANLHAYASQHIEVIEARFVSIIIESVRSRVNQPSFQKSIGAKNLSGVFKAWADERGRLGADELKRGLQAAFPKSFSLEQSEFELFFESLDSTTAKTGVLSHNLFVSIFRARPTRDDGKSSSAGSASGLPTWGSTVGGYIGAAPVNGHQGPGGPFGATASGAGIGLSHAEMKANAHLFGPRRAPTGLGRGSGKNSGSAKQLNGHGNGQGSSSRQLGGSSGGSGSRGRLASDLPARRHVAASHAGVRLAAAAADDGDGAAGRGAKNKWHSVNLHQAGAATRLLRMAREAAARRIQVAYRRHLHTWFAACRIQRAYRGHLARRLRAALASVRALERVVVHNPALVRGGPRKGKRDGTSGGSGGGGGGAAARLRPPFSPAGMLKTSKSAGALPGLQPVSPVRAAQGARRRCHRF